jgi:hypothetical protein
MMRATKSTWVTRRLEEPVCWTAPGAPVIGDVLLCEVVSPSLHGRVETADGRRARLYPGDLIACAVGSRYATSLLEGVGEIDGPVIDLLSASGLCGKCVGRNEKAARPTRLRVLAQAFVGDQPLNLSSLALPSPPVACAEPAWVVVVGSAMDSGKTTACASLIQGLHSSGYRVGAAKVTGTASARDFGSFQDAGADPVLDFLDVGLPSTAGCSPAELRRVIAALVGHLRARPLHAAVLEVADGLLQSETAVVIGELGERLERPRAVLTARESLAAVAGVERLVAMGYEVAAVSGVLTNSPLASREVERACGVSCIPTALLGRELVPDIAAPHLTAVDRNADAVLA